MTFEVVVVGMGCVGFAQMKHPVSEVSGVWMLEMYGRLIDRIDSRSQNL